MQLEAGLQVNPNVKLVRPLGQGGMGSVWVAAHLTLRTEVAVKFIDPLLAASDPTMLTRFEREASTAAQIKSPHVVQMLDHGLMANDTPYIVMELLEGESLDDLLERVGRLDVEQVASILNQCAKALSKAHEIGIVHRDLKPDNLFLIDSGYDLFVKVLDFGIAKQSGIAALEEVTSSVAVVGTPLFMSLEQLISTKDVTHSTDLWALAVIAYLALTGAVPFDADTLPGLTMKVLEGHFTPATTLVPELPSGLDAWFATAFQKAPTDRFKSADELAMAFRHALGSTVPSSAAGPAPLEAAHGPVATAPTLASAPGSNAEPWSLAAQSGSTVSALTSAPMAAPPAKSWPKVALAGVVVVALIVVAFMVSWGRITASPDALGEQASAPASSPAMDAPSADPAPSVEAPSTSGSASSSAAVPSAEPSAAVAASAPAPRGTGRLPPAPTHRYAPPPAAPTTKPVTDCSGNKAFYRNESGRLVPRPECL